MGNDPLDNIDEQLNELKLQSTGGGGGGGSSSSGGGTGEHGLSPAKDKNLNLILDIPLKVTVELGRTKMAVSELLNLTQGRFLVSHSLHD